ncbi:MAG: aminoacyl-histidine dipeptidase [Bacteroidales bacterium]|nr:aminoacyl-histidine dipeptidase [Bacteroidales bacterium]
MNTIADLSPQVVWKNFYALTQIPRPSKFELEAAKYICDFGKNLGLESFQDEVGNVIIRKPATPGMEDRMGIILQAHIDMVPQKNNDVEHDFKKDPIKPRIVDNMVYATGTTLGADNGLGCAVAMAVLESKDMVHGPIEVLITIDEETGMTGARALKPGVIKGDILINLDSETEGELYVGCAGGLDCSALFKYTTEAVPAGYVGQALNVKGLVGGHSGMDIILYRANANKVLVRALLPLLRDLDARLISIEGGNMRNAIPREGVAYIAVPEAKLAEAKALVAKVEAEVKVEYAATDKDAKVFLEDTPIEGEAICQQVALNLCKALYACPSGVERMSDAMPGLVETSNNMAIVKSENGTISVHSLMRSSVDTAKDDLAEKMRAVFELAGAEVSFRGGYSGWAPNMASPILKEMKAVYEKLYGKQPAVMAIHAGLECGILGGTYPNWDMVSCGPTIFSPHSPDERVEIDSVGKWWDFVVEVLKNAPKK